MSESQRVVRRTLASGEERAYRYPRKGSPAWPLHPRRAFGDAVRAARKRLGYTLEQVADMLNVPLHWSMISHIERKGHVPCCRTVDALAGALGLDLDEARVRAGYAPVSVAPEDLLREPLIPELREVLRELGTLHPCGQRGAARRIDAHLSP